MNAFFEDAIAANDVAAVRRFLREGEETSAAACSLAIRCAANSVLRVFIDAGADLDETPHKTGETLLVRAVKEQNLKAFRMLVKAGASLDKIGYWMAPIHVAAKDGLPKFVKDCLTNGADIELRDRSGNTPLMWAAGMEHSNVVTLLLKAGADPSALSLAEKTALELAEENNKADVVEILTPLAPSKPRKKGKLSAFLDSVVENDLVAVDEALLSGVDPNLRNRLGRSALDIAISNGSAPMAKRLVQAGVELNRIGRGGISYLESALRAEHWNIARFFLENGAMPNPLKNQFVDAIHTAIHSGDIGLIQLLVSKGSNPKERGLLADAALLKKVDMVRYLLSKGANPNEVDSVGWTPLFWAVFSPGSVSVQYKKKLQSLNVDGVTFAAKTKVSTIRDIVKALIDHGADVNYTDKDGRTAADITKSKTISRILRAD